VAADDALDAALIQFKQEQDDQVNIAASASMHQAITQNPDEMARYNAIARKTGFDPLLIATDPAVKIEAERRAKLQDIDLPGLVQTHPKTASALTDANLAALVHDDVTAMQYLEDSWDYVKKGAGAVASSVPQAASGIWGTMQAASDVFLEPYLREFADLTGTKDVGKAFREQAEESRKRLGVSTKALMPQAEGVVEAGVYSGLQSMGTSLLTLPLGLAGSPAAALGTMAAVTGGEAYGQAADKGIAPVPAAIFALSQGALEYATEKIPMGALLKDLKVGTPFYKTVAHQMAREIPGEQLATLTQDLNEWAVLHPEKPFSEYIAERPSAIVQTLIATIVGTGGTVATLKGLELFASDRVRSERQITRAEGAHEALTQLSQAATAAKLRERDPAQFKAFMQSMVEDSDLKEVFVDGTVLQNALAQAPAEVQEKFAKDMPEVVRQIGEAASTDGLVRVPVEDYATHIAGTELDAAILPNLKTEVDGLTYAQAQEQVKGQTEQMKAEADQLLAEKEKDTEFQADAQRVYDALYSRIEGAQRFTPDANKKYAALQQAYFITRAQKLGVKPSELLAQFDIQVQAERTGGAAELEQQLGVSKRPILREGKEVGYLKLDETPTAIRIADIEVKAEERNKGFGSEVIREVMAQARKAGKPVVLSTDAMRGGSEQKGQRALYERLGFVKNTRLKVDGVKEEYVWEPKAPPASSDYGFRRRAKARVATLEDFKPENIKSILRKTNWAILTAENPNAQQLSAEENARRNVELKADLDAMGVQYTELEGKFRIVGVTREQALDIGQRYGQALIETRDGRVGTDFTVRPALGVSEGGELRLGESRPLGEDRVGEVTVEAVHFAKVPQSVLNGRVSFYVDEGPGVRPEAGVGAFRHELTLSNIYDGTKNPLGFPTESNAFEAAVVEAGFDGYVKEGKGALLGDATQNVEVDIPPRPTEYAQALNEVAETLPPTGKLEQQDLADLRKLWTMYAASETAAQYGTAQVKAYADDAPGLQRALSDTLDAVMQGMVDTSVKNITHWHEGTQRLPAGGFAYEIVSGNSSAAVYLDMADRSMQIDITRWGEGRGGSGVYKALLDFAQANGFVFYGDAQGISVAGIKRRLENLLSHALQSGDTKYMRLHPKQIDFIEQETGLKVNWTDDSKNNVEQMLNASYNLANLDIPELKNVYFDFTQREFIARNTGAPADLAGLVAKARRNPDQVRREGAPGLASAKRTVFANTLLSAKGETRRTVFAEMARLSLEQLPGAERLLYQSEPPGERPPFYSALTRAFEETKLAKASPDQWLGTLKSLTQKGVKPMEIEYTGLQERLEVRKDKADSWHVYENGVVVSTRPATDPKPEGADVRLYQPSKVVTKEEIIDFLKENAVTVEPRVYGGEGVVTEFDFTFGQWETEEPDENWLRDQAQDRVRGMGEDELSSGLEGIADEDEDGSIDTAIEAVRGYINESGPGQSAQKTEGTRGYKLFEKLVEGAFEQERENYWDDGDSPQNSSVEVEAGGRTFNFTWTNSYHEHFLYAHESNKSVEISGRSIDSADIESAIREFLGTEYGISEVDDEKAPKFESYKLSGGENYRERLLLNKSHKGETFSYTNHFDDDNIIGHSRVDDREVPVEAIEKEFPELAARMKAEGRTTAKVYFIEEVQSDWAQQGRERPEAQKHYAMEDLVFNEKASARNDDRLARIKVSAISDRSGYTHTRDRGLVKDQVEFWHLHTEEDLSAYPSEIYTTKEAAERGRFAVAGAVWVIEAPNQVFEILRAQHPTVEEAKRYIADVKTTMVPGEMTAFELARKQGALQRKLDALRKEARALAQGPEDDATNAEYQSAQDRIAEVRGQLEEIGNKVVTPGAFVESTDAWVGLVVKDAVHQAAKGGFDLISWTTGDQQTQRWSYGLRKQVDLIEWTKSEEGKIHIVAMQRGVTKADTKYGENDLSAAIGKTMAKRIIEDPNQNGFIEGEGITVADLGMTKFYGDTAGLDPSGKPAILTKVANQVAKKLGGGQVVAAKLNPAFGRMSDREKGSALNVQPTFEVTLPMRVAALQGQVLFQSFTVDAEQVKKLQEKLDTSKVDAEEYYKRGYRIDDFGSMDRTGEDLSASDMFQKNRGTFNPDTLTISLLKDADLTTFLHETGHFFLEMEAALASDPRATPEMRDDFTKVLNWFGVKDLTEWNALSFEQKRSHHEKFARGFEAYLFEGKAPSNDLRSIFASFKTWLLHVYRSITNLNVELTDEVRGVFDRMLASEEAIATVQRRTGLTDAMIEAANSKDKAAYLALNLAAGDNAGDDLQRRSLRDMKWLSNAKSQELKKLQREAASKRKEVRAEVTAEVNAEPINQARAFLRKGTTTGPDGESIQATEGFRLNHAIVAEMYPETMLARPDLSKLRGMTEADGLHPDLVADMFGFRSGDALIRELIDGENPRDKINGMTDQRMMERYGDLNDERAIENAANSAVHNEARARFMATGLKMLSDSKLPASQIQKAATDAANQAIAAKKVRDLHPAKHIAAETKANKDVLKNAAKDVKAAQRAQRSALLNNRLAKASQDAQEEVRKGVDRMTRTQKAAAQKNMRGEYLIQLNELLARFDLRKSTTLKEIDAKRTPLAEWLAAESERMSAVMPDIPAWILNEANRTSYKDLTVEEFRGVVDTVKQLEMMARREETQYQAIRGMKFAEERKALLDRIREFHPEAFDLNGEPLGMAPKFVKHLGDKVEELGEKFAGEFLNAETLVNLLEGGEFGIAHESLLGRMSKRADWKATRLEGIYNKMAPLFGQYSVKERYDFARKDIGAPIGMSLTRENALVVALLHGNTEGRERLANYGWSEKKQEEIINLLDDRDMALAQGIWDLFDNDLWPELKDLNDRTRGKAPPKVVAIQVFHRGGTYRGGYFRLKYDTNLDERAYRMDEGAAVKELLGGGLGMSAKTGQGASTERKQNVTMRPRLDLGVFAEAVSETVHDIAYREAVADTMRMLNDTRVQNTIKTAAGVPAYRALVTRVREIAAPPRNPSGFVEKTLSIARKNTIVTLMSGVNTALQNFTGFVSATARVNPGRLAKEIALFYSTKMTERVNFAMEHSEYMRHRHNAFERDLQNEIKKMTVNASIMPDTGAWLTLMALVDKGTSVPVWNAAFHEGMVKYENDNGKAADYADHVVRQSQGSGRELDVAQIMSGHGGYGQLKRVFTMFYSYFNAQLGMLVRSGVINAHASKKNPAMAVARFTKDFMVIVILPAVLTAMIFKKDDPDEDPEKWLHKYSHAIAMYGLAMIPLVRDVGSFAWASFDHDVKNYGYKITPVQSAGEGVVKGAVAARDIAVGEGDDRDLKNLIMGTSFAVGLPGKLISDITLGTKAFLEGEAGPEAILFGPPKK
jgi:ribosomal protein S18 acetylase RimI-like enzyme